jgi:hypothetical protein
MTAPRPDRADTAVMEVLENEVTLRGVLASVRHRLGVDVVTVLELDPGSRHLVTVVTDCAARVSPVHHRVPLGRGLAGTVALAAAPVALGEIADDALVNPLLIQLGVRSVLGVPIFRGSELSGVLKLGTFQQHDFGPDEIVAAERMAVVVGSALEEYFAADDRVAALALQRSLVPTRLPDIAGLDLAGRYIPGEGGVSGDWYDVFTLPGGAVGMAMGDVAGHGLPASVVMGRLRSALRAYALEYDDPAEVLSHLDAKIMHFEPGAMATALYAVSQPPFETMHLSSAGHFLPIVVRADGDVVQVEHPVNLPLGVDLDVRRTSSEIRLEPDGSLVMFTDGLIERRTRSTPRSLDVFDTIDSALDELRALLRTGDADRMASAVLDAMLTIEPPSDDVALLIVRRTTGRAEGG